MLSRKFLDSIDFSYPMSHATGGQSIRLFRYNASDMIFETNNSGRAESYRTLAQSFLSPPDEEMLDSPRQDFSIGSKESLEQITEDFNLHFSLSQGILKPIESLFTASNTIGYTDVNEFYVRSGLIIDDSYETVPDHISPELIFMSYLLENNNTEMAKKFLEQHLMNWVPYYCDLICEEAKTAFHRKIGEVVKFFLTAKYEGYKENDHGTHL